MFKKKLLFPAIFAALFVAACSNDFDIAAPWQEIPVVYGIISPNDTAHYVRIEKAFLDPNASAYVVAKIADSLYYPAGAISVFLENVNTGTRTPMTRVDGNSEGHPREEGNFSTAPNWLYKVRDADIPNGGLRDGNRYRLVIERADGRPSITAETTVPDTLRLISPNTSSTPVFISFESQIVGTTSADFSWRVREESRLFNLTMIVRYREVTASGVELPGKSIRWRAATNIKRGNDIVGGGFYKCDAAVPGTAFYKMLADSIPPTTDLRRYFGGIDVEIEGGGAEIAEFLEAQASNSGLTGSEVINTYSNLSEGLGIFSSKKTWRFYSFQVDQMTVQAMSTNPVTRNLNFKG